ncbi:MAG: GH32 C-terminal domain-containing protein [Pseudomonadota bacterium]
MKTNMRDQSSPKSRLALAVVSACAAAAMAGCSGTDAPRKVPPAPPAPGTPQQSAYLEPARPQLSFSAAKNWMNDPNGLVYYDGEYHLFYQYNPNGSQWGDMSWGHAVSTDLVRWTELPLALPVEKNDKGEVVQLIFSGSAVVDANDTSGLGRPGKPAMVAVYTSVYPQARTLANGKRVEAGTQAQSLAYSTDRGRSWTRYAGNPVIALPPGPYLDQFREFRDPKVFWHEPEKKWVMVTVIASLRKALLYSSKNLREWEYMSEFGPANAVGGAWECPDLFEMAVDGTNARKWVLTVSLNPGGVAGGSGSQYFTGQFDGRQFKADNIISTAPPAGTLFEGFEGASYAAAGWQVSGALGLAPGAGNAEGHGGVAAFEGKRLANTGIGGDAATGTLSSPVFKIEKKFINLLVGGGHHPHDPDAGDGALPAGLPLFAGADFEGPDGATYTATGWSAGGDLLKVPVATGAIGDQQPVPGFTGKRLANTYVGALLDKGGDAPKGTLSSPAFALSKPYINFLIGGGTHPWGGVAPTAVVLKVDGKVVRSATGKNEELLQWTNWDVREFAGQQAQIVIVDDNAEGWGHISADHFMAADQPALPPSRETSVKLLVDGKVVRSATGDNAESLAWNSWNVAAFLGRQAQIQIVDRNSGGWGHILVDHIVFSDQRKDSADWLDFGSDFYAAVTWNGVPDDKRIAIGWMSNWNYAGLAPNSPWRGAQAMAREWKLRTIDGVARLVQEPVQAMASLRTGVLHSAADVALAGAALPVAPIQSSAPRPLEIEAEFKAGTARSFGLKVHTGANGDETVVGYDAVAGELYVDRSRSGALLDASFGARHGAPLPLRSGLVKLRVVVDNASVTVFANDGEVVLTEQIFPGLASNGMALFSEGGTATVQQLKVWLLKSIWAP